MRIGIFSNCYLPTLNGVVVSIETFRKEMEKRGHEYFIFAPETKEYKDKNHSHVFRYPSFTVPGQEYYPLAKPFSTSRAIKDAKKLKLDLIHTQHSLNFGTVGLRVARALDIPVVHTYHTLIAEYTHYIPLVSSLARKYIIANSRDYCNSCDQIVTPSSPMKRILRTYGVTSPIESIPTGISLDGFDDYYHKEILRAKWHIPEHQKILLYLSRVAKEKNLSFLFKVMRRLVAKRQKKFGRADVHLILVGGGPELKYYQQLALDWGLETHITFTDMMPKEKANRFYGAADIYVFPSITETQGIVITEAMAAGTPVVAVNKMGPTDLIENGVDGYLTSLNIDEFSGKIEKLLDDRDLRRKMGEKGRENAKKFSSLACALKMETIYEKTISRYAPK